jgi:hypothetical protein
MNLIIKKMHRVTSFFTGKNTRRGGILTWIIFLGIAVCYPVAAQELNVTSVKITPVLHHDARKLLLEMTSDHWSPGIMISVSLGTKPGADNLGKHWYTIVRDRSGYLFCQNETGELMLIANGLLQLFMEDYPVLPGMEIWSEVCVPEHENKAGCRHIRVH